VAVIVTEIRFDPGVHSPRLAALLFGPRCGETLRIVCTRAIREENVRGVYRPFSNAYTYHMCIEKLTRERNVIRGFLNNNT